MKTTAPLPAKSIGVLICPPIFVSSLRRWSPLSDIPNVAGFQFVGCCKAIPGAEEVCEVMKRADGTHTLKKEAFSRITGWRCLTDEDRETIANAV